METWARSFARQLHDFGVNITRDEEVDLGAQPVHQWTDRGDQPTLLRGHEHAEHADDLQAESSTDASSFRLVDQESSALSSSASPMASSSPASSSVSCINSDGRG